MRVDLVLQVAGIAGVVAACFLFSSFVGRVALVVAGVLLVVMGLLEELHGSRTALREDGDTGDP